MPSHSTDPEMEYGLPESPSGRRADALSAGRPVRVQLRRTRGWKMPPNTVRVCRPTIFGNPFTIEDMGRHDAVEAYRHYVTGPLFEDPWELQTQLRIRARIPSLRGKNLGCWCAAGKACHADVLLELANAPEEASPRQVDGESSREAQSNQASNTPKLVEGE